jgi:hypothetical protein
MKYQTFINLVKIPYCGRDSPETSLSQISNCFSCLLTFLSVAFHYVRDALRKVEFEFNKILSAVERCVTSENSRC